MNSSDYKIAKIFDSMQPFSILINNGHDAVFISCATLAACFGYDKEPADKAVKWMVEQAKETSAASAVKEFFDGMDARLEMLKEPKSPVFLRPMFTLMIEHWINRNEP